METNIFDSGVRDMAWCPGCGNFGIRNAIMKALTELGIEPRNLVMVSGIGQAAKMPHYLRCNTFNGLHGRALPPATGIKASNPGLTVIAESGDGDMYGEGGNHFMSTIRRNPDITNIVHDNMVYGLTKGQASPTSPRGFVTPVQVNGVILEPFNPLAVAVALDASFVARAFSGDMDKTVDILKKAITHKGYALVDILHPCVSFNKINTFAWFREHTYYLDDSHDFHDRNAAFTRATEKGRLPLGILYENPDKPTFEESLAVYQDSASPIIKRELNMEKLSELIDSKQ
ncbi:thiamine pyrophosphate-dependent enzyme [bacterium]|nr:thiamine pyrophosphate-dependent enzyme [bacterium]